MEARAQTNWALLSGRVWESNVFELEIRSEKGAILSLETSDNLQNWGPLQTVTNGTGRLTIRDSGAVALAPKYYRALVLDGMAYRLAEDYCARAGVVSEAARAGIYQFLNGVAGLGLITNLLDFAFFCEGQNTPVGSPISLRNQAVVVGAVNRLRGGLELRNNSVEATNYFYFTNLPAVSAGGSLLWWGAGGMNVGPRLRDANVSMGELTSAGSPLPPTVIGLYNGGGGYAANTWNGISQGFATESWYPPSGAAYSLFCAGYTWMPGGCEVVLKVDHPPGIFHFGNPGPVASVPAVVRFGQRNNAPDIGWWGLVRGFAYFSRPLSTNEIVLVDALLPRVGVIVEGDSKSLHPQVWWMWWAQNRDAWGLYALRTNSAQEGSLVSSNNTWKFYGSTTFSAESRFDANEARYPTNSTYPIQIYSLRSGHNDLNAAKVPDIVANSLTAITNLWARARTNGWKVAGWTVDRTTTTWTSTNVFPAGASNALQQLNGELRRCSALCDYLVDNEAFYVQQFGETPYTNTAIYVDGVHDDGGSAPLGTDLLLQSATPSLGYETPPQPVGDR